MERARVRGWDRPDVSDPLTGRHERRAFAELFAPAVLLAVLLGAPGLHRLRRSALAAALVLCVVWVGQKTVDDLEVSTTVPAWAADTHGVVQASDGSVPTAPVSRWSPPATTARPPRSPRT